MGTPLGLQGCVPDTVLQGPRSDAGREGLRTIGPVGGSRVVSARLAGCTCIVQYSGATDQLRSTSAKQLAAGAPLCLLFLRKG